MQMQPEKKAAGDGGWFLSSFLANEVSRNCKKSPSCDDGV